jgi:two-component sensor histidine kinase
MSAGLEESYKKIKLLIHDIHHRVKNNLTVIHSLMSLERQRIDPSDPRAAWKYQDAFESLSVRILVISSIYSQLYGFNDSIETVDCKDFLERLIEKVSGLHNSKNISVSFKLSIESLPVSLNTMIPLALIINEIVSNSFKHAFPERSQGGITLELAKRDGRLRLWISDDGAGLREDFSALKERSLGMQLIDLLSSQIKADMTVNGADGTSYTFIIGDGNGADTDSRG